MISRAMIHGRVEFERIFSEFEGRLQQLYRDMDHSYEQVAQAYGFFCTGCETSCCETRFYHHTLAEYCYLRKGVLGLGSYQRQKITVHATAVLKAYRAADEQQKSIRIPCPLNQNSQCIIYPYRPMICRLHGIPHEFQKPEGKNIYGPGCDLFNRQCGDVSYKTFDRTPFYRKMAFLEQEVRQSLAVFDKFKMTIAEMLLLERDITP